jgi:hypothetical protein
VRRRRTRRRQGVESERREEREIGFKGEKSHSTTFRGTDQSTHLWAYMSDTSARQMASAGWFTTKLKA